MFGRGFQSNFGRFARTAFTRTSQPTTTATGAKTPGFGGSARWNSTTTSTTTRTTTTQRSTTSSSSTTTGGRSQQQQQQQQQRTTTNTNRSQQARQEEVTNANKSRNPSTSAQRQLAAQTSRAATQFISKYGSLATLGGLSMDLVLLNLGDDDG